MALTTFGTYFTDSSGESMLINDYRFEAFDEPWKITFNQGDQNWEDKWGLMYPDRTLKPGLKIPDCDGKTVKKA